MRGGIDAIYTGTTPVRGHPPGKASAFFGHRQGLTSFAEVTPARGHAFTARERFSVEGEPQLQSVFPEKELYGGNGDRGQQVQ